MLLLLCIGVGQLLRRILRRRCCLILAIFRSREGEKCLFTIRGLLIGLLGLLVVYMTIEGNISQVTSDFMSLAAIKFSAGVALPLSQKSIRKCQYSIRKKGITTPTFFVVFVV
jgi:hypothetical protein